MKTTRLFTYPGSFTESKKAGLSAMAAAIRFTVVWPIMTGNLRIIDKKTKDNGFRRPFIGEKIDVS
jgi:hypothetical protein